MSDPFPKTPSFRLDGRRAIVTGAGRGIGRAAAAALAEHGAHVTLVSRNANELRACKNDIEAAGGAADICPLDMAEIEQVAAAFKTIGPVNILVNNAGTNRPAPLLDVTSEDFDAVMELNVRGAFFCTQAVVREMRAAGIKGSVIHMSSQMGHVGGPNRSVYCATKHAVEGMTKAMALDLAPLGIRVNAIAPTFIETPMTRPFLENETFTADTLSRIPLGRLGQVEDLMGAVVYLASDASALVTGTSLLVDGGWTTP